MTMHSDPRNDSDLLDLLNPELGIEQRRALVDLALTDAPAARQLRLALGLDGSAQQLASGLRPAQHTPWLRLGLPVAAAALLALMWPQHDPAGQQHQQTVASVDSPISDELLSGSFEAGSDAHFGGGFE